MLLCVSIICIIVPRISTGRGDISSSYWFSDSLSAYRKYFLPGSMLYSKNLCKISPRSERLQFRSCQKLKLLGDISGFARPWAVPFSAMTFSNFMMLTCFPVKAMHPDNDIMFLAKVLLPQRKSHTRRLKLKHQSFGVMSSPLACAFSSYEIYIGWSLWQGGLYLSNFQILNNGKKEDHVTILPECSMNAGTWVELQETYITNWNYSSHQSRY